MSKETKELVFLIHCLVVSVCSFWVYVNLKEVVQDDYTPKQTDVYVVLVSITGTWKNLRVYKIYSLIKIVNLLGLIISNLS